MDIKQTIFGMLKTNTGTHMLDSGGASGRAWQRNADKTLESFETEPLITGNKEDGETISLFHYLTEHAGLSLDSTCNEYNDLPCKDWESDIYGVSKAQKKWLKENGFTVLESFNSYNGEQYLSQVIQGTYITQDGTSIADYVLLQVHQGADVRGGYTDAKMFKVEEGGLLPEIYLLENNE